MADDEPDVTATPPESPIHLAGTDHVTLVGSNRADTIEIATDEYDVPDERRDEVLATAQRLRVADGADYAKEEHLVAALEELGPSAERNDIPDTPTGSGVD